MSFIRRSPLQRVQTNKTHKSFAEFSARTRPSPRPKGTFLKSPSFVLKNGLKTSPNKRPPNRDDRAQLANLISEVKLIPKEYTHTDVKAGNSNTPEFFFHKGYDERTKGSFHKASEFYRKGLRIMPSHLPCRLNLGIWMMKTGGIQDAIDCFNTNLRYHADDTYTLFNKCLCLIQQGKLENALMIINQILNSKTLTHSSYYTVRGYIYYKLSYFKNALADLKISTKQPSEVSTFEGTHSFNNLMQSRDALQSMSAFVNEYEKALPQLTIKIPDSQSKRARPATSGTNKGRVRKVRSERVSEIQKTSQEQKKATEPIATQTGVISQSVVSSFAYTPVVSDMRSETPMTPDDREINRRKRIQFELLGYVTDEEEEAKYKKGPDRELVQDNFGFEIPEELTVLKDGHSKQELQKKADDLQEQIARDRQENELIITPAFGTEGERDINLGLLELSRESVVVIREEFKKPREDIDFEMLARITAILPFFSKFVDEVQQQIWHISNHVFKPAGTTVFEQDTIGEMMYVLLSGSITVIKSSAEYGENPIVINTLKDGNQFGELSFLATLQNKGVRVPRSATCIAGESCDLLEIPKTAFHKIMIAQLQTDIDVKLKFFKELSFFSDAESILLIPLASNLTPISYRLGEKILKAGDKPKGLYIIKSGQVQAYTTTYMLRPKQCSRFVTSRVRKSCEKRSRDWKNSNPSITPGRDLQQVKEFFEDEMLQNKGPSYHDFDRVGRKKLREVSQVLDQRPLRELEEENELFPERIVTANLKEKDFFGGRALLDGEIDMSSAGHGTYQEMQPSMFTMVANSATVEVFILTRYDAEFLNESLKQLLFFALAHTYEVDCPKGESLDKILKQNRRWEDKKANLVDELQRNQFLARNKYQPEKILFDK